VVVNADFIEFIEPTPDTVITLTTGKKMMVHETVDEVIERIVEYRQRIGASVGTAGEANGSRLGAAEPAA